MSKKGEFRVFGVFVKKCNKFYGPDVHFLYNFGSQDPKVSVGPQNAGGGPRGGRGVGEGSDPKRRPPEGKLIDMSRTRHIVLNVNLGLTFSTSSDVLINFLLQKQRKQLFLLQTQRKLFLFKEKMKNELPLLPIGKFFVFVCVVIFGQKKSCYQIKTMLK